MEQGTVKWFNDAKGFGFISRQNGRCVRALLGDQHQRIQEPSGRPGRPVQCGQRTQGLAGLGRTAPLSSSTNPDNDASTERGPAVVPFVLSPWARRRNRFLIIILSLAKHPLLRKLYLVRKATAAVTDRLWARVFLPLVKVHCPDLSFHPSRPPDPERSLHSSETAGNRWRPDAAGRRSRRPATREGCLGR